MKTIHSSLLGALHVKRFFFIALTILCSSLTAVSEEIEDTMAVEEQPTLTYEQIEAKLKKNRWKECLIDTGKTVTFVRKDRLPWSKENWTFLHTNEGIKPFKPLDDLTFVGIPIFAAGWIAKGEKHAFKQQDKHSLVTHFKTDVDDYLQYFGPALTLGLKVGGLEGRSDWGRFLATTVMSYFFMDWSVTAIKYTSKEMRPNGTSANSWPSGHTATSFAGATILHKEYGLTRSPWYSVAGYGAATATGVMRVLNNAHWVSDVICGAGIGIMTTELAYVASDLIFGRKGLLRDNLTGGKSIIENPSFFSISMGMGWGSRNMDFDLNKFYFDDGDGDGRFNLKFGTSTAVGVEGAYFFNKYFGVGGRLRVNTSPIKGWDGIVDRAKGDLLATVSYLKQDADLSSLMESVGTPGQPDYKPGLVDDYHFTIQSDHLTEFAFDLGAYFNLPISNKFAVGTKLLFGRSVMQELSLEADVSGGLKKYRFDSEGNLDGIDHIGTYNSAWDYFTVSASNSFKAGTGVSLTYAYKDNFAWKLFVDYDLTRKTYTMAYNPGGYLLDGLVDLRDLGFELENFQEEQSIKKNRHTVILGGSFTINF